MSQKTTQIESVERADRIEEIFTALLEYPVEQRKTQLHLRCGEDAELETEIESLLHAADKAHGFLSEGALASLGEGAAAQDSSAIIGQQFDSWRILRELDSGGMGIVFLAERNDGHYQQQVAIKLARLGLTSSETVERFHTERQILANLRHPNISQLLDGGTGPDGHSYLVMEYVQGDSIDTWCDSQNSSVDQILRLMLSVFDAVDYAHRNLIVHCDLKPSNILVSEGVPKLLDFGIATLLLPAHAPDASKHALQTGNSSPMTPSFAAPEQINGDPVSTATDIYALGIVLYRLLSGNYPYSVDGLSRADLANAVRSVNIRPPSERASKARKAQLQGDLDNIVMKALTKDPQQRYTSIQAFSSDIHQYLEGYPVGVTPNTWWYRCRKFTLRNKWGVALTAVAVMSLWVGSFFSVWQWRVAMEKQDLAEKRFSDVRNMTSALVDDLPNIMASQPASTTLRVQLIDQGIAKLDELVRDQSDNTELIRELAIAYKQLAQLQGYPGSVNLGEPAKAVATFEKSLALQHELLEKYPDDIDLAVETATNYRALTVLHSGPLRQARIGFDYADKCRSILKPWLSKQNSAVVLTLLSCLNHEAKFRIKARQYQQAKALLSEAEKLLLDPDNRAIKQTYMGLTQTARWHEEWAEVEANIGSRHKALQHERKRLDIFLSRKQTDKDSSRNWGPKRAMGDAYHAYGARLAAVDRLVDAEYAYLQAVQIWTAVKERFPADSTSTKSLIFIYAEMAELHKNIAATHTDHNTVSTRLGQACRAYQLSLDNVSKMPGDAEKIPHRYSWSPETPVIRQRYKESCLVSDSTVHVAD